MASHFKFRVLGQQHWDTHDDNIDVVIELPTGDKYAATFFTIRNIQSIINKYRATGECESGLYLWASNMVVVNDLERDTIQRTIESLLKDGEFAYACKRLEDGDGAGRKRGQNYL